MIPRSTDQPAGSSGDCSPTRPAGLMYPPGSRPPAEPCARPEAAKAALAARPVATAASPGRWTVGIGGA